MERAARVLAGGAGAQDVSVPIAAAAARGSATLEEIALERGYTEQIACDNRPEFRSRVVDEWAYEHGVALDFIQPGKPVQNPFESFYGKMRDECLNVHWFADLDEARWMIENCRKDYTQVRPHSSLGDRTPSEFAAAFSIQTGLQGLAS